jgi:hypothetical protein
MKIRKVLPSSPASKSRQKPTSLSPLTRNIRGLLSEFGILDSLKDKIKPPEIDRFQDPAIESKSRISAAITTLTKRFLAL